MAAVMAQLRPDECSFTVRALRAMSAAELSLALTCCDGSQRAEMTRLAGTRLPTGGKVRESQARLIRTELLRATSSKRLTDALDILTTRVRERCVEVLGDDFDDPSREAVEALLEELRDEFHDDLVRLYLSLVVDADAVATPLLVGHLADGGSLRIPSTAPLDAAAPRRRRTSDERRAERTERRRRKSQENSERREQRQGATRFRRQRRADASVGSRDDAATTADTESVTIEQTRLPHPHVSRFRNVSADSAHRGLVGTAFIPYSGGDGETGKIRPCVVVAAGRKHALLRPLYSFARRPAGGWRAVELREWEEAGLEHASWVGDELHVVRWRLFSPIGTLTTADWNRICRGEVN